MLGITLTVSKHIKTERSVQDVLCYVMEEIGELSTEVAIKYGNSYKEAGKDGIIGEAVDAIINLIDLIRIDDPEITHNEIMSYVLAKLNKWNLKEKL